MTPLLSVRSLVKRFRGLVATDHASIEVMPGEIHALIGPNGAGKSTLINQISGELAPDQGQIEFAGREVTAMPMNQRALAGLVRSYQITSVFQEFTALQNVMYAVQAIQGHSFRFWQSVRTDKSLTEPAAEALELVGLGSEAHSIVGDLAHGARRQLELAMALALKPQLMLLDEPLAGMSQVESEAMIDLLGRLKGRYGIVLVEHDMDAVFSLADRVTVLVSGKPIVSGSPAMVKESPEVREAYLGDHEEGL